MCVLKECASHLLRNSVFTLRLLQYEELIPYTHLRNLISKVRPVLGEYVSA